MKKFLAIFLVLTLVFSFAACKDNGNDEESSTTPTEQTDNTEPTSDTKEPSSNKKEEKTTLPPFENPNLTEPANLFKVVDVNDYDLKEGKPNTFQSSGVTMIIKRYSLKNEIANAIPDTVSVGSSKFTFMQTTLKDILAQGWTLIGRVDANQAVEAGEVANVMIKNSQDNILKIKVKNMSTNVVAVTECVFSEAGIVKSIENQYDWVTFTLGDTVNTNSNYAEVINGLGKPKSINATEYYKGNDLNYCKATLVYEYKSGNTTYTVSIGYVDEKGKATLDSFIVSAK